MTISVNLNYKDANSKDSNIIRHIPLNLSLRNIISEQIQTQDVFHIGFYPENNHLDIDIYEFLDFKDIYYEAKKVLCNLNINPSIKKQILNSLLANKYIIAKNIEYFGDPHFWSI
jgi:hypothetical protein